MQIRLAVISNAGGSGKTTLSVHLAYDLAKRKYNVALLDLDPQGSLTLFCGLNPPEPEQTLAGVLKDQFDGVWPLTPCWSQYTNNVVVCQGGMVLTQTADAKKQEKELESLDLSDSERAILSLLLDLQLNPASIDANIFPMLSLAEDLKLAIRAGLKGVHAMALQKLSAKNLGLTEQKAKSIREETTHKVIVEKLSVVATRKLVAEVIASESEVAVTKNTKKKAVSQASNRLQKLSLELLKQANPAELIELQEVLRHKLVEIEKVLKQN